MTYRYEVKPGDALNLWQMDDLSATPFESPVASFDPEDRFRVIATQAIDMKTISEILYPVREAFLREDFITSSPYVEGDFKQFYFPGENRKVDFSNFSHDPKVLSIYTRSYIHCDEACSVEMEIKTCGGVKIWLNGEDTMLFKPYERNVPNSQLFQLNLEKGDNEVLLFANDLAERDVFFYYELINRSNISLECYVPLEQDQAKVESAKKVIDSICLEKDAYIGEPIVLRYDQQLLENEMIIYWGPDEIEAKLSPELDYVVIGDASDPLDTYFSKTSSNYFPIRMEIDGLKIETMLFLATYSQRLLSIKAEDSIEDRKAKALEVAVTEANKNEIGTALAMLAHEGECSELCRVIIEIHLKRIEDRLDCADFRLAIILLMVKNYGRLLPGDLHVRIKKSALNFRYWCDEPGNDVMWFFSENHALLFHVAQYLTGDLYPEEVFVSGKSSAVQKEVGYQRIIRWFDEFLPKGYDEWNSLTYLPVDCIAFFTLFEVAPDLKIRNLAKEALDYTFRIIAVNMHHKVFASSYGRTYEHTLKGLELGELAMYGWIAWNQGTVNVKNHAASLFAVSAYIPLDYMELRDISDGKVVIDEAVQGCHNTLTYMYKSKEYALASAMKFHPFETGMQQHFVNLSFSEEEIPVWLSHPGEMVLSGHNRPSYWGGWQTIPYVEQYRNVVIAGVQMHETDEVKFIHVNIPLRQLDTYVEDGQWFFFNKDEAYGALWFANGYALTTKGANTDKEIISHGSTNGFIVRCGAKGEFGSFEMFRNKIKQSTISFNGPYSIEYEDIEYGKLTTDLTKGMMLNGEVIVRES